MDENLVERVEEMGQPRPLYSLDPQQITVDRLTGLIVAVLVTLGTSIGGVIYTLSVPQPFWLWILVICAAAAFCIALFVLAIVWPVLDYRFAGWRLDEFGLLIRRGVLWRHQITVPAARVQHVDVSQGPLQRNFGIGTLVVNTAGTANSSVELSGLPYHVAIQLRDELVAQKEVADVV